EVVVFVDGLGGGNGVHGRIVNRVDGDGEIVAVGLRGVPAGITKVVGGNGESGGAAEVSGGNVRESVKRGVDVGKSAAEDHGGVGGSVAGGEGETGGAGKRKDTIGDGKRDQQTAAGGVYVGNGNRVSISDVENDV